jgi:hypothetical protein
VKPISAAEIVARRHPQSVPLTPAEFKTPEIITRKLAEPSPDRFRNQKESNREGF